MCACVCVYGRGARVWFGGVRVAVVVRALSYGASMSKNVSVVFSDMRAPVSARWS